LITALAFYFVGTMDKTLIRYL